MNNKISIILIIPILVILTTATAYGLGYEVNQFKIVLSPGESKEFHRVLLVEKNASLEIAFIGEGNEWFTLTNNNIKLDEKRLKIPFTVSIPNDVESAGDYMICMTIEQKGDPSGIIKIPQSALIPIIITVMDSDKPQREELVFNRETVQEKCKIEEEQGVVEIPKLEPVISEIISLSTDKTQYRTGDRIIITGEVRDMFTGTPVVVTAKSPNGFFVFISQLSVSNDKTFSDESTASEAMRENGEYTVTATYGESRPATTTFQFIASTVDRPTRQVTPEPMEPTKPKGLPPLILKSPSDKSITLTESDKPYYLHNIKLSDFLVTDDSGETSIIECESEQVELERKTRVANYNQNSYTHNNNASITFDQISNKADFNPNNNRIQYMGVAFVLPAGEHEIICFVKDNESNTVEVKHTVRIISDALAPSWVKTVAGWYTQNLIDQPTYLKVVKYFQLAKVITFDIDNAKNIPDIDSVPSNFKSETRQWTGGSLSNMEYKEKLEQLADRGIFENINLFENIKTNGDKMMKDGDRMVDEGKMMEDKTIKEIIPTKYTGTFIGVNDGIHNAEGDAYTIPLKDGSVVLRLENFKSTNGPDLYVYLATDNSASDFVNLGELKANRGNQNYEIPDNMDLTKYNKVLIWCKSFSVLFGSAEISPQT